MATVRELSKPGRALVKDAPTATKNNPDWFIDGSASPSRRRLHDRLLAEARAAAPGVEQQQRAIVLAGPPGAGKGVLRDNILGTHRPKYLAIDADEFKILLLREALADGSYGSSLVPQEIRDLEALGEKFYPLELAALVHEESSDLSKKLRGDAIEAGDNIIIDTVLSNESEAVALGQQLQAAGYSVEVIDVEVPYEISEERIRDRWETSYTAALEGGDPLGGRWVPSAYAREVFDGPGGVSKPEAAARSLAAQCAAVSRYRVFRTAAEEARAAAADKRPANATLEVDRSRSSPGAALIDTAHAGGAA